MADGTSVPVGVISPAGAVARPRSSMKKLAQRQVDHGLPAVPAADPAGRRVRGLSGVLRDLSQHAEQEDDHVRRAGQFRLPAEAPHLPAGDLPELPVRHHRGGLQGADRLHPRPPDAQHPGQEPAHLARPAAGALGDPAGAVHADLVVDVRSVLFGVQLDPQPVRLRQRALARRGLDRALLHHHGECLVRHAVLHDHVSRRAEVGAGAIV